MVKLKTVVDKDGSKIYPITITNGIYDIDNNQRLNVTIANVNRQLPHYITSPTGTAGSTVFGEYNRTRWAGSISGIAALYTGLMVLYKIPEEGMIYGTTLNINSLGEHPVVLNASTIHTTHYPVGAIVPLVYDADLKASVYINNVDTEFTGCWKIANYDSDTTYESKTASFGGTDVSLVTTGEKYTWGQKQDTIVFNTAYDATTNKAATMADVPNVSSKEDKVAIETIASGTTSITTQVGKYYNVAGTVSALTINLPSVTDKTVLSALEVFFTTGSNTPTVTITPASGDTISYFSGYQIEASKTYELNFMYNGAKWIVAYAVID